MLYFHKDVHHLELFADLRIREGEMWWTKLVFGDQTLPSGSTRAVLVACYCYDLDFDTMFLTNPE